MPRGRHRTWSAPHSSSAAKEQEHEDSLDQNDERIEVTEQTAKVTFRVSEKRGIEPERVQQKLTVAENELQRRRARERARAQAEKEHVEEEIEYPQDVKGTEHSDEDVKNSKQWHVGPKGTRGNRSQEGRPRVT